MLKKSQFLNLIKSNVSQEYSFSGDSERNLEIVKSEENLTQRESESLIPLKQQIK